MVTETVSFLLAILPAGYVWWTGRRLVQRLDDPAFPELRFATSQRIGIVMVISVALSLAFSVAYATIKIALAILAVVAADFPTRRQIFDESWGLFGYLKHTSRFWLAMLGLCLLLALLPFFVYRAGSAAMPTAIFLTLVALLWSQFNAQIFPKLISAKPLESPELESRFAQILERARCRRPRLLRAEAPGGHWINAIALPSHFQPRVIFTASLLDALTPEETSAVFAHEVGHLEHLGHRTLLKRDVALSVLLIVFVVLVFWSGPNSMVIRASTWVWPLLILFAVAHVAARNQANEHKSDLRALELIGDPQPLISALTKIHQLMRMPRRWRRGSESTLSHPSLAKRLRAIREAAGAKGLEVDEAVPPTKIALRSAKVPSDVVVMMPDQIHWLHGVDPEDGLEPVTLLEKTRDRRSITYSDLRDLRLEVSGLKRRYLTLIDARGKKMRLALQADDVPVVRANLESVERELRGTSPDAAKLLHDAPRRKKIRFIAVIATLAGLLPPFSLPFTLTSLLVLLRPMRVNLAAAGAVGIAAGLLALRGGGTFFDAQLLPIGVLVDVLAGVILLIEISSGHHSDRRNRLQGRNATVVILATLAAFYLLGGLGRLGSPLPFMGVHLWARHDYGAILALLGVGAALFAFGDRKVRLPASAAVALALLLFVVGTLGFRDRFGDDPMVNQASELETQTVVPQLIGERIMDGAIYDLRISPAGSRVAARMYPIDAIDDPVDTRFGFEVETADGNFIFLEAFDLAFLEDERVAIIRSGEEDGLVVQTLLLMPDTSVERSIALPPLADPRLRVEPRDGRWEVASFDYEQGTGALLAGDFSSPQFTNREWSFENSESAQLEDLKLNAGRRALAVSRFYRIEQFRFLSLYANPFSDESIVELSALDESGSSRLALTTLQVLCPEPPLGQTVFVCGAHDRESTTQIFAIDTQTRSLAPLGALPDLYWATAVGSDDRVLLHGFDTPPLLVLPEVRRAVLLDINGGHASEAGDDDDAVEKRNSSLFNWIFDTGPAFPTIQAMALQAEVIALATLDDGVSTIRVYRLPLVE